METKSFECRTTIKGIDERTAQQHEPYDRNWYCVYKRLIVAKVLITLICVSNGSVAMAAAPSLRVRCCYFLITMKPIVISPVSYSNTVICFSESCFLLVSSYGSEWASVCECPMIRLRQLIWKHGQFQNERVFAIAELFGWIGRMSGYMTNVTNLTRTPLVRRGHYFKYFYSFSFFPRIFYSCDNLLNECVRRVCCCLCLCCF